MKNRATILVFVLTVTVAQVWAQDGRIDRLEVSEDGLVAHFYRPVEPGRYPAVILLGGSGGGIGWQDQMAELLARRGVAALAVAYFGMPGLGGQLERIPLEYIDQATTFLRGLPSVDPESIGIGGVSKGGELALLVASKRPAIRAVGVFVPSGIVFQSVTSNFASTSSWSYRGEGLPFVPYGNAPQGSPIVEYYRSGLKEASPELLEAAAIKVEQINGPILMLSGKEDTLWPSTELAEMMVARLKKKGFAHPVKHVAYENAGHLISSIRDDVTRRGGTDEGNRAAQIDGQKMFIEFFLKHLKNSPEKEIEAASRAFSEAYVRGDTKAIRDLYTEDAVIFPPGQEIRGNSNIAGYFAPNPKRVNISHSMTSSTLEFEGDLAVDVGTWNNTWQIAESDKQSASGRYLVIWRRGADGRWRIQYDMWHRPS